MPESEANGDGVDGEVQHQNQQAIPKLYVAVIKDGKRVIVEEIDTTGVSY